MPAEIFTGIDVLRLVLETETDKDSPDNETTYGAIRKLLECLFLILLGTGVEGTVEVITETVLTDTGNFVAGDHLEHTLVMRSGNAKGHAYTIDSNTVNALTCTGDTLVSDGVQVGDSYVILHDIKTSIGHTHDAKNTPNVLLADRSIATLKYIIASVDQAAVGDSAIGQGELKTTEQIQSQVLTTLDSYTFTLTGGQYCHMPQYKVDVVSPMSIWQVGANLSTGYTGPHVFVKNDDTVTRTIYVKHTYHASSGEIFWIFLLKNKSGEIIGTSFCSDHPQYGHRSQIDHPFNSVFDPKKHDIIVINPTKEQEENIRFGMIPCEGGEYFNPEKLLSGRQDDPFKEDRNFMDSLLDIYNIDETKNADWPDIPITINLPRIHENKLIYDWRSMPVGTKIKPVQAIIKKPDYINCLSIKEKR